MAVRGPQGSAGLGRWRGAWASDGDPDDGLGGYIANDLVVYQGTTYRANQVPTVGVAPANDLKWDIVAQAGANGANGTSGVSFTYQGDWVSGTPYLIGQWVSYGGSLYYCNGNIVSTTAPPNIDVGWNLGMSAGAGGFAVGDVPMAAIRASAYLFTQGAGSQGSSTTVSVNTQIASPIYVPSSTTADRICLQVNTAAATALWRLGVYADSGSMYPGALMLDAGTIDASTTGVKEITPGAALTLPAGVYWVAAKCETAHAAARGTSGPVWGVVPGGNSSSNDVAAGYVSTNASAGLSTTWPAWGVAGTGTVPTAPRVGIRVTG